MGDLDVLVLRRQYRWTGHIARLADWELDRFLSIALDWRDGRFRMSMAACGRASREVFCPIGHSNNWTWELQFHRFFDTKGKQWRDVAADKVLWRSCERDWISKTIFEPSHK